jgi:CBS domain-containing protein
VDPRDTIEEAARTMENHKIRKLAVVDQARLVGVITVVDLAKALAKQLEYSDVVFNAMARVSKAMSEVEVGELEARLSVAKRELEVAKATIGQLEQQLSKYRAKTREN